MADSLLERIQENRLDALYLFINETLRDPNAFNNMFQNLLTVLPHNWSIQRVEIGHEFLSMVQDQETLFRLVCKMDSLRTLIVSDGYVPRKDNGSIFTDALLEALPKARNLSVLDVQRLELCNLAQVDAFANVLMDMEDTLEEIRVTGLSVKDNDATLDTLLETCSQMGHLKSLAISMGPADPQRRFFSNKRLQELLQESTTLQDLTLRAMHLDDRMCQTIAQALQKSSFLTSLDIRQNPEIGVVGYTAILEALEKNYDLWCSVMVDDETFQGKFNALIELNQAGRGDLLRTFTLEKLTEFLGKLSQDATAMWFFLCIHECVRTPLIDYLLWKDNFVRQKQLTTAATASTDETAIAIAYVPDSKRQRTLDETMKDAPGL
jgi:hypothetical protein